jgi:hypothetical protein
MKSLTRLTWLFTLTALLGGCSGSDDDDGEGCFPMCGLMSVSSACETTDYCFWDAQESQCEWGSNPCSPQQERSDCQAQGSECYWGLHPDELLSGTGGGNSSSTGSCSGVARSCFSQSYSYSCNDVQGCYWSYSSDDCSGVSTACYSFFSSATCSGQPGCYWTD